MLGVLRRTGYVYYGARELVGCVICIEQVHKVIRARLVVGEVVVIGIAIHYGRAIHAVRRVNYRTGALGYVVKVAYAAAVSHDGIAIAICIRTFCAAIPRLYYGLDALVGQELAVFVGGLDLHAVVELMLIYIVAGAAVGMSSVHEYLYAGYLRTLFLQLSAYYVQQTGAYNYHVAREEYRLILARVHDQRRHRHRVKYALAYAHVELSGDVYRSVCRYVASGPSYKYFAHVKTLLSPV